ncbi:MAG: hypothetical protein ACKV2T_07045 [Kofleriaceae bacterium]
MIPIPSGWTLEHLPEAIMLVHPRGKDVARIHYKERAGRPRRIDLLAREIVSGWPNLSVNSFGAVDRFVTNEGEVAALVGGSGTLGNRPIQLELGFVLTDDFYTSSMATTFDPSIAVEVHGALREAMQHDSLVLGLRRRRFQYLPPVGWQPIRRSLMVEWIPPDYPAHETSIVVYPASPVSIGRASFDGVHTYLEGMGSSVISVSPVEKGTSARGVTFEQQDVVFQRPKQPIRKTRFVVMGDMQYQYLLELRIVTATDADGDKAVLRTLVDSVVPFSPIVTSAIQHWID